MRPGARTLLFLLLLLLPQLDPSVLGASQTLTVGSPRLTMGMLPYLLSSGTLPVTTLQAAVVHAEPGVRAVAARMVGVQRELTLGTDLSSALSAETDGFVAHEQVRSLLLLGTPDSIAAAETFLERANPDTLVTYARWLARTNAARLIERMPWLVERLGDRATEIGRIAILAAAAHATDRQLLFTAVQRFAPADGWSAVIDAALSDDFREETIVREALASPNDRIREQTVWTIVGHIQRSVPISRPVLEAALPADAGAAQRLTWETFGREIIAQLLNKTYRPDRSRFIGTEAANHRDDALPLLLIANALTSQEASALRKALAVPALEIDLRSMVVGAAPRGIVRPSSMRLVDNVWPGFITSLFEATRCVPGSRTFGAARLTFGADGRPTSFAADTKSLSDPCAAALRSFRHVTLADDSELGDTETVQVLVFPATADFARCSSGPRSGPARRVGEGPPGQTVDMPRKTRDVKFDEYPAEARQRGLSGVVVIEGTVSPTGCVSAARVIRSASPILDYEALRTVSRWLFAAPRFGNDPISVRVILTASFGLGPLLPH